MLFNGKIIAEKKLAILKTNERKFYSPKLVAVQVGENISSGIFLREKKKVALYLGARMSIVKLDKNVSMNRFIDTLKELNSDEAVDGIMIQLPLPKEFSNKERAELIHHISSEKDVDGMRDDSSYTTPVVKAVLEVLGHARSIKNENKEHLRSLRTVVVGSKGFEGKKIAKTLIKTGYSVLGVDKEVKDLSSKTKTADILISATGVPGIISGEMVKDGVILIDVGSPKGDIEKSAYEKASFVSPVPGGIGPLTVYYLMENLVNTG